MSTARVRLKLGEVLTLEFKFCGSGGKRDFSPCVSRGLGERRHSRVVSTQYARKVCGPYDTVVLTLVDIKAGNNTQRVVL